MDITDIVMQIMEKGIDLDMEIISSQLGQSGTIETRWYMNSLTSHPLRFGIMPKGFSVTIKVL